MDGAKRTIRKDAISFLLYLLPILAFLNMVKYENKKFEIAILLATLGAMACLLVLTRVNRKPSVIVLLMFNAISLTITGIFYSSLGSIVQFLNLILMLFVFNEIAIEKKTYRRIHFLTFALLIFYLMTLKILDGNLSHIHDFWGNKVNPNLVSVLFFAAFLHLMCWLDAFNIPKLVGFPIKVAAAIFFLIKIDQYESRSILISFALFLVLAIFVRKDMKFIRIKGIVVTVLIISVVFSLIYVLMHIRLGDDVKILGKSLYTGREIIWKSAFEQISDNPIFGSGNVSKFESIHGTTTYASHHTVLGLWKILGIVPLLTFVFCLVRKRTGIAPANELRLPKIIMISVLPICFFESFYIDAAIYVYFTLFLLRHTEKEREVK